MVDVIRRLHSFTRDGRDFEFGSGYYASLVLACLAKCERTHFVELRELSKSRVDHPWPGVHLRTIYGVPEATVQSLPV